MAEKMVRFMQPSNYLKMHKKELQETYRFTTWLAWQEKNYFCMRINKSSAKNQKKIKRPNKSKHWRKLQTGKAKKHVEKFSCRMWIVYNSELNWFFYSVIFDTMFVNIDTNWNPDWILIEFYLKIVHCGIKWESRKILKLIKCNIVIKCYTVNI